MIETRNGASSAAEQASLQSEKMLDLAIANGRVVRAGNQFGVGMKPK